MENTRQFVSVSLGKIYIFISVYRLMCSVEGKLSSAQVFFFEILLSYISDGIELGILSLHQIIYKFTV